MLVNDILLAASIDQVPAQMRYINAEWKHRDEPPRIGNCETRGANISFRDIFVIGEHAPVDVNWRANTSFQGIVVHNARAGLADNSITLEQNGFTLSKNASACTDFRDEETVKRVYYPEVEKVVRKIAGADHIFISSHLIRTETPIDFNHSYARFVHCDYNIKRLKEMSEDVLVNYNVKPKEKWDYVWFNTWQPFENPAINNPMAFLDWSSLPIDDVIDYFYTGTYHDTLMAAPVYNPDHVWRYIPAMETDEIVVFKQMDGRGGDRSIYCPHTSFDNKNAPENAPPRRSCETRILAVYERA